MIESFTTERTSAERMRSSDLDDFLRMSGDARVMATLGGMKPDGWTRAFVEQGAEHWERHGFGLWVFRDRADGRWIGRCGLRHVDVEGVSASRTSFRSRSRRTSPRAG